MDTKMEEPRYVLRATDEEGGITVASTATEMRARLNEILRFAPNIPPLALTIHDPEGERVLTGPDLLAWAGREDGR